MHVKILILIVYIFNYQANTLFYENMRNDFKKSFLVRQAKEHRRYKLFLLQKLVFILRE